MTDIEKKALAYACECAGRTTYHYDKMGDDLPLKASITAHARAIEAHEAFKRGVSDAVERLLEWPSIRSQAIIVNNLSPFIIKPPVDPLVEVLQVWGDAEYGSVEANALRAALAARGLEVRKIEGDA